MTPSSPSPDDRRDELASALLDGALPAGEADAARRDPAVAARAAEMAAARDRVRDVPPLPASAGDDALAAALGAYDNDAVTSLAARRSSSSSGRRRGAPRWLGAAAALILVVGVIAGLAALGRSGSHGDRSSNTAAASGGSAEESPGAAGSSGADHESATRPQATVPAGVGDLGDLGDAPSAQALARRVAPLPAVAADSGELTSAAPQSTTRADKSAELSLAGCAAGDATRGRSGGTVVSHGRARAGGVPVDVWIVRAGDQTRVVVLDADCRIAADEPAG